MKILFLYPDMITKDPSWRGYYYEGLAMLAAVAKRAGHDCQLLHVAQPLDDRDVLEWVEKHRDGNRTILAFSATTNQFPHVKRWASLLKNETGLPTLVGGMHPTLSPEDAIQAPSVDMICCGDGEGPLVELANRLEKGEGAGGVRGIWWKDADGKVVRQPLASNVELDGLPPPDWAVYPNYRDLEVIRLNIGIHLGSRGCPYDCAYCCNRALIEQSKGRGKYMRFKPIPQFLDELRLYLDRYPETWGFFFEDDIFGVSKKWLLELAPIYKREIGKPFGCNMRPNLVEPWLVDTLVDMGCVRVHMAIEAGDEEVRNRILNRRLSREKLVSAFRLFKDQKVQVQSYNIIGSPHETPANVLETIKVNAEIDPEWIQHSIFFPYEGTPLYDLVHKEGLVAEREVTDYFADTALEQDSIRRDQVLMFQKNFKSLVRHYQRIEKLPEPLRDWATKATDRFLVWGGAPKTFDAARRFGDVVHMHERYAGAPTDGHAGNGDGHAGGSGGGNGQDGARKDASKAAAAAVAC